MPAAERRACIVDAALAVFARRSYRGVTTAEIARAVGVSEPILYRHFASKRELFLACLEETWLRLEALWQSALEAEPDPAARLSVMGDAYREAQRGSAGVVELWVQALTEAGEDDVIRQHLHRHLRVVHDFVSSVIRRSQADGAISDERIPAAEAWIFISLGFLATVGRRLDAPVAEEWTQIIRSRRAWMSGVSG
jgi:AcrR family transcriptional regulator